MTLDQQTAALLAQINQHVAGPDEEITIADARLGAHALFTGFAGNIEQRCQVEDRLIEGLNGNIPVRIYHPGHSSHPLPLIIFFHGGGWSLGDVASYDSLVHTLASLSGTIFISVDYRLAPEHKYPAGLNDCIAVTEWAFAQGGKIGGDVSKIAVMGDSAGGTLAAVVAHKINSTATCRLKAQFLLYPVMDISQAHSCYPSRMTSGNGEYLLSCDGIDSAVDWYLEKGEDKSSPLISPLLQDDLSSMPPTVIVIGGYDPLKDEAVDYHQRLQKQGVPTTLKQYDRTIHAFLSFGVLDVAQEGRLYIAAQVQKWLNPAPD